MNRSFVGTTSKNISLMKIHFIVSRVFENACKAFNMLAVIFSSEPYAHTHTRFVCEFFFFPNGHHDYTYVRIQI